MPSAKTPQLGVLSARSALREEFLAVMSFVGAGVGYWLGGEDGNFCWRLKFCFARGRARVHNIVV